MLISFFDQQKVLFFMLDPLWFPIFSDNRKRRYCFLHLWLVINVVFGCKRRKKYTFQGWSLSILSNPYLRTPFCLPFEFYLFAITLNLFVNRDKSNILCVTYFIVCMHMCEYVCAWIPIKNVHVRIISTMRTNRIFVLANDDSRFGCYVSEEKTAALRTSLVFIYHHFIILFWTWACSISWLIW